MYNLILKFINRWQQQRWTLNKLSDSQCKCEIISACMWAEGAHRVYLCVFKFVWACLCGTEVTADGAVEVIAAQSPTEQLSGNYFQQRAMGRRETSPAASLTHPGTENLWSDNDGKTPAQRGGRSAAVFSIGRWTFYSRQEVTCWVYTKQESLVWNSTAHTCQQPGSDKAQNISSDMDEYRSPTMCLRHDTDYNLCYKS